MEYYGNNDWRDHLALRHHGILGMKWGKRNGPPYPLGASDHSASEKKAGWRKSLGRVAGGGIGEAVRIKKRAKSDRVSMNEAASRIKKERENEKANRNKYSDYDLDELERMTPPGKVDSKEYNAWMKAVAEKSGLDYDGKKFSIKDTNKNGDIEFDSTSKRAYEKALKGKTLSRAEYDALVENIAKNVDKKNAINAYEKGHLTDEYKNALDREIKEKYGDLKFTRKTASDEPGRKRTEITNTLGVSVKEQIGKAYSPSAQKNAIETARKTDSYRIDFLEAIQNKEIMYRNDTNAMLKEYEKYLKDPEDYWKKGRNRLKDE